MSLCESVVRLLNFRLASTPPEVGLSWLPTNVENGSVRADPGVEASIMVDVREAVESLGGFAQKQQLVRLGARDRELTRAVKSGLVVRVRNGWYSTLPESDQRLRALRVGGRLTGLSAIVAMGGWVMSSQVLHVAVNENAARLRTPHNRRRRLDTRVPGSVRVHWEPRDHADRGEASVVALIDALFRVVMDEKLEDAVAALDWALHFHLIDRGDVERLMLRLPHNLSWIAGWADAACESLPESFSRTRFRLAGHAVRSQVPLPSEERIDLLVDGVAAFEVDGRTHHADSFLPDRAKDLRITIAGFHALRPAASMIFRNWDDVYLAVSIALIERGRALPPPVGNSGFGRFGPRSRAVFTRGRRNVRYRYPEISTGPPGVGPLVARAVSGTAHTTPQTPTRASSERIGR